LVVLMVELVLMVSIETSSAVCCRFVHHVMVMIETAAVL
jgi:hypothetical protein